MTVNDCTTGICLLCYKEITSITAFRRRCARANEYLKSRYKNDTHDERRDMAFTIISNRKQDDPTPDHLAFIDLGDEDSKEGSITASNSLWEKSNNFEEISGGLFD